MDFPNDALLLAAVFFLYTIADATLAISRLALSYTVRK